jgi:hypothetical protein
MSESCASHCVSKTTVPRERCTFHQAVTPSQTLVTNLPAKCWGEEGICWLPIRSLSTRHCDSTPLMSFGRLQHSEPNQQASDGEKIKYNAAFMVETARQESWIYFRCQHRQRKDPDCILGNGERHYGQHENCLAPTGT